MLSAGATIRPTKFSTPGLLNLYNRRSSIILYFLLALRVCVYTSLSVGS